MHCLACSSTHSRCNMNNVSFLAVKSSPKTRFCSLHFTVFLHFWSCRTFKDTFSTVKPLLLHLPIVAKTNKQPLNPPDKDGAQRILLWWCLTCFPHLMLPLTMKQWRCNLVHWTFIFCFLSLWQLMSGGNVGQGFGKHVSNGTVYWLS